MPKPPSPKTLKSLFKLISLDLAPKLKSELERGIDPNVAFDAGYGAQTALMYALDHGKAACARVLLDAGADVTRRGGRGDTALHEVREIGFAKELIERGADVNAADASKRTPLHEACAAKYREVVALLLEHGAKVEVKDAEGKTPYALAHDAELRALLLEHGAKGFGDGGGKQLKPKTSQAKWKDVEVDRGAIGVDGEGNLWCCGYSGLFRFDGKALVHYQFEESFAIDSVARGPKGVVYFATNWGLLRLREGKFTLYSSEDSELFDNHLVYMCTAPDGRAYMLSYEDEAEHKHISVFDGKAFTLLSPGKDFPAGLDLKCLAFDEAGKLVIGADGGIAVQRGAGWKVITKLGAKGAFAPHVYDIVVDHKTLWIGTQSGVYEFRNDKATLHPTENLAKCLCKDGDALWIGMYYGGLGRLHGGRLEVSTAANSVLPDDDVERVVRAPDGTIWVHAGSDIARVKSGVLERVTGEPAKPVARPKPRKLRPFPAKPIVARARLPRPIVAAIEEAELAGITAEQLLAVVRPAIAFDCVKYKTVAVGASKFGGQPDLPPALAWPAFADDPDEMLPFVMQFELAAVHPFDKEGLLPAKGMLYVFCDTSPDDLRDARVLYADVPAAKLARRAFPEDLVDRAKQRDFIAQVPEYKLELGQVFTLPSHDYLQARAELTDEDRGALDELRTTLVRLGNKKLPQQCSRLLGWPDSVQGDVVEDLDDIALLQLNGYELSPKGIEKIFEHWCSDGLIHFVIDAKALAKQQLHKATGSMAYT